jgi:hypothetical protein
MSEEPSREELSEGYDTSESVPYVPYASPKPHVDNPSTASHQLPPPSSPLPASAPPTSAVAHTQTKNRRVLWIALSILILLLISVASLLLINYIHRSTPDKTLSAFCTALQRRDYRSAYGQFSRNLQRTVSEAAFAAAFSQDSVTACSYGASDDSQERVAIVLMLTHASKGVNNDIVTLIKDGNDDWKIDDVYKRA